MTRANTSPRQASRTSSERNVAPRTWPDTPQSQGTRDVPLHDNQQGLEDFAGRWYALAKVPDVVPREKRRAPPMPSELLDGGRR